MKRKVLSIRCLCITAFVCGCCLAGNGQSLSRNDFRFKNFNKAWFVSVNGGLNLYYGDWDLEMPLSERFAPALDIAVGKWLNPYWGMRMQYVGLKGKGMNDEPTDFTDDLPDYGKYYIEQFNYMNLHVDAFFYFLTIMNGFETDRNFEMLPFVGIGFARAWNEKASNMTPSFTMGLENRFRISKQLDFNFEFKGTIVGDKLEGVVKEFGSPGEGVLTTTIGFTYKFTGPYSPKVRRR